MGKPKYGSLHKTQRILSKDRKISLSQSALHYYMYDAIESYIKNKDSNKRIKLYRHVSDIMKKRHLL